MTDELTPRQQEVARLLVEGCTHRQIAERLTISPHTASHHVRNIRERLGAQTTVEAVVRVVTCGAGCTRQT